jgi:hypothetical protein
MLSLCRSVGRPAFEDGFLCIRMLMQFTPRWRAASARQSDPDDDSADIAWTRKFWSDMLRHSDGRLYLNFAGHGEDADLVRTAVGTANYQRLVAIKRKYDPTNLSRINQNILPV